MLDVHAPHEKVHGWRDFFIHIATIVVGLLIAVGLEQVVEHVHQHYELRETMEALDQEMQGNSANLAKDERNWLYSYALLENDLLVLRYIREHPGAPASTLPGVLSWVEYPLLWDHAVWDAALAKGIVRAMPLQVANRKQEFYQMMTEMGRQTLDAWNAANDARRFDLLDPDPTHLTPAELSEVIQRTEIALSKHIQVGYSYGRYAVEFPEIPHSLTYERLAKLRLADMSDPRTAAALQSTRDRVDTVMKDFGLPPEARN